MLRRSLLMAAPALIASPARAEPRQQVLFSDAVQIYHARFRDTANPIKREAILAERARALRAAMGENSVFKDWDLEVAGIGLSADRKRAHVILRQPGFAEARFGITNMSVGKSFDEQWGVGGAAHGEPLFDAIATFEENQRVRVTGNLIAWEKDGFYDMSLNAGLIDELKLRHPIFAAHLIHVRPAD